MLKNVSLIETHLNGKPSRRLLDPDGHSIPAFDIFARTLDRAPVNTRKNYLLWLAEFFDFLFEAATWTSEGTAVNHDSLVAIIEAYDEYLVLGPDSGNPIAKRICQTKPSPLISRVSSATKHAAIRRFLKLSERIRVQMLELTQSGFPGGRIDEQKLIPGLCERRELSAYERQGMVRNSMLAGCISSGPKLIQEAVLPTSVPDALSEHGHVVPFDRVVQLLTHMTTYRDKALYAFCAASGCRISEALQLLWEDVNIAAQKVQLVDPKRRPHSPSYLALEAVERDSLVWKGRATFSTLLIDPFATIFFEALVGYLRHEYVPHGRHTFVFQYTRDGVAGCPYYLSKASSRNGVLKRALKLTGLSDVGGAHTLRRMYGTYLLNYFPRADGTFGLPIALVQKLMGHRQIKDTAKYALYDRDLLEAELHYANMALYGSGELTSLNVMKRNALLAKLRQVENEIANESGQRQEAP